MLIRLYRNNKLVARVTTLEQAAVLVAQDTADVVKAAPVGVILSHKEARLAQDTSPAFYAGTMLANWERKLRPKEAQASNP